jgi:ribosome-binding factor A
MSGTGEDMTEDRRAKRVGRRIMEEVGRFLIEEFQGPGPWIVTVTRVEVTPDLMTARVFVSVFGDGPEEVLARLEKSKAHVRRLLASRVNLKYNPELVFLPDPAPEYVERLDRLIEMAKKHED